MKKNKLVRRARRGQPIEQVAALPYRFSTAGELEVLLLTSRGTGRFIVPKGWPMKGAKNRDEPRARPRKRLACRVSLGKNRWGASDTGSG